MHPFHVPLVPIGCAVPYTTMHKLSTSPAAHLLLLHGGLGLSSSLLGRGLLNGGVLGLGLLTAVAPGKEARRQVMGAHTTHSQYTNSITLMVRQQPSL